MSNVLTYRLEALKKILNQVTAEDVENTELGNMETAKRLVDVMLIEHVTRPEAIKTYFDMIRSFLPEIKTKLASKEIDTSLVESFLADIENLSEDVNLENFEGLLQRLQQFLQELYPFDGADVQSIRQSLARIDADYARSLMSESQKLAGQDGELEQATAQNAKSFDKKKLEDFLSGHFTGETNIAIKNSGFISGGHSKFTLGLDLSNVTALPERIILRADARGAFSGAGVAEEYALVKTLYDCNVCVPKPLALETTGDVFGAPFLLCEYISGNIIGHMFNLPKTPDEAVCIDIARQLARLHRIPVDRFGKDVENADTPNSYKVSSWLETALNDFQATGRHSMVFEIAFEWLRKNAPLNDKGDRVLVHGDYGLNNILIKDHKVTAILDWEFAHIGNPAYDLAYFYYMAESLGSWDLFLDAYQTAGASLPETDQLNYNLLLAATRLGVQTIQVETAFNMGLTASAGAAMVLGRQYFNESITRIYEALNRVL